MTKSKIYTIGGTVQAGKGIYITRNADAELYELCRQGEFTFILSSRQVGKSSLMVRTAERLAKEHRKCVVIDLTEIGVRNTHDEWYLGILTKLDETLELTTNIVQWWKENNYLGETQRLVQFFRDVVLKEISESIVIFFDEIDSTLSIPFSDDFFAAIRSIYNSRATTTAFQRLSFVLIGTAAPTDLIRDARRTPFNIGRRVELSDFSFEEAIPLSTGLDTSKTHGITVLKWIFEWTNGHPYLTQKLCNELSKKTKRITKEDVEEIVSRIYLGEYAEQDHNLQFVRDMLVSRAQNPKDVLKLYSRVLQGNDVKDDEQSYNVSHLKLSGIVRVSKGSLHVSNKIYKDSFSLLWVKRQLSEINRKSNTFLILFGAFMSLIIVFATYSVTSEWLVTAPPTITVTPCAAQTLISPNSFQAEYTEPKYVYVLIDTSGSYREYTTRAIDILKKIIPEGLNPGDHYVLASLGSGDFESLLFNESVPLVELPAYPATPVLPGVTPTLTPSGGTTLQQYSIAATNDAIMRNNDTIASNHNCSVGAWNLEYANIYSSYQAQRSQILSSFYNDFENTIDLFQSQGPTAETNVYDALYLASKLINRSKTGNQYHQYKLIIFSDLIDTRSSMPQNIEIDFSNVDIVTAQFVCQSAIDCQERIQFWTTQLQSYNANSVDFILSQENAEDYLIGFLNSR